MHQLINIPIVETQVHILWTQKPLNIRYLKLFFLLKVTK